MFGLEDYEGENIFIPSAQAEVLKDLFLSIIVEDDEGTAPALTIPAVIMPVP